MMVQAENAEEPRGAAQTTDEDIDAVVHKSTEVKAEFAENPTESWSDAAADDARNHIRVMGETKVAAHARARGRPASENELGVVISQIRKFLSTAFIRAHGLCLLNRLCFLGAKEAAGRRDLARRLEISRKRDLQAHNQSHIRCSGLARSGLIFVP